MSDAARDLLDRRQRLAACILLGAVDLPQQADEVARLWIEAASVCPNVTVTEARLGQSRRAALIQARDLIGQLLAEMP